MNTEALKFLIEAVDFDVESIFDVDVETAACPGCIACTCMIRI